MAWCTQLSKAAKRGCFKRGGFPIWTCPSFLSFLGLSRFFWDFPDLLGDGPRIFPNCPFPLSRPIKSTYEEQSRKGPRHNLDLSRKKVGNTRVLKPPGLASLKVGDPQVMNHLRWIEDLVKSILDHRLPNWLKRVGSKQKGPAEQVAPRASSLKICRF